MVNDILGHIASNAEHQRAWRDRQRGKPPREPSPCGTYAAFRRHQRKGEPIDDACREAYNEHQREQYRKRQADK